jgi:hypothetical protein
MVNKKTPSRKKQKVCDEEKVTAKEIPISIINTKTSLSVGTKSTKKTSKKEPPIALPAVAGLSSPNTNTLSSLQDELKPFDNNTLKTLPSKSCFSLSPMSSQVSISSTPGLTAFGMKPSAVVQPKTLFLRNRNSTLKCCLVHGINNIAIVFRCESIDKQSTNGSWSEKLFSDAIRLNSSWVKELNFDSEILNWYHNNLSMKNPRGWPIRIFSIRVEEEPPELALKNLGRYICQQVNDLARDDTNLSVNDNDFFWLSQPIVWSDIIGNDAAFLNIKKEKGNPRPGKTMYLFQLYSFNKHSLYCRFL